MREREGSCLKNLNAPAFKRQIRPLGLPALKYKLLKKMENKQTNRNDLMFVGSGRWERAAGQSLPDKHQRGKEAKQEKQSEVE